MGFEHHYCHRDKYESLRQVRCSTGFYRDACDGRESCEHDSTAKNGRDAPKQKFESADSVGHYDGRMNTKLTSPVVFGKLFHGSGATHWSPPDYVKDLTLGLAAPIFTFVGLRRASTLPEKSESLSTVCWQDSPQLWFLQSRQFSLLLLLRGFLDTRIGTQQGRGAVRAARNCCCLLCPPSGSYRRRGRLLEGV